MIGALANLLPIALGVAISPIPVMATILMLLAQQSPATSLGYLIGWATGILLPVMMFTFLACFLPEPDGSHGRFINGGLLILIGLGLTAVGIRQWRTRAGGQEENLPRWMSTLDSLTPKRAFTLALTLSFVNPKTMLLAASAALIIRGANLGLVALVFALAWFTVFGSLTIGVPVLAYRFAPGRFDEPLQRMRTWMVRNSGAMMAGLTILLGLFIFLVGIVHA